MKNNFREFFSIFSDFAKLWACKKVVKLKGHLHFSARIRTLKNREIEESSSIKCKQTFTNFSNYFRFLLNYCNQKIRQIEGISELLSYIVNNFHVFFRILRFE